MKPELTPPFNPDCVSQEEIDDYLDSLLAFDKERESLRKSVAFLLSHNFERHKIATFFGVSEEDLDKL